MITPRVVHCKREAYTLYIGRPSKWGNPYIFKPSKYGGILVADRAESIIRYEEYARENLWNLLQELEGEILGCWCKPQICHGDILIKLFKEKFVGVLDEKV